MSWSRRKIGRAGLSLAALAMAAALGGCGYRAVYATSETRAGAAAALERVEIANIPDRAGQLLRNNLIDRFYHGGYPANPDLRLEITVRSNTTSLALRNDASSERTAIATVAVFRVVNKADGKVVVSGSSQADTGVAGIEEQYGARAALDSALERSLVLIADDIALRVGAALPQKP
jgi:LPS-assembly lipoprotein